MLNKDLLHHPNLASMKISGWHKERGNNVTLLLDYDCLESYNVVYVSKVFTDTPVPVDLDSYPNVMYGGTGFYFDKAPPLPSTMEHHMPDYHLYDDWVNAQIQAGANPNKFKYFKDYSIGFMTRGCIRGCSFCVNRHYKQCNKHASVSEFLDPERPYICLWDDNVLACPEWREVFAELQATGKRFQFKQGMDERLLTREKINTIFSSKWIGDYIFAFDNIKDKPLIVEKLKLLRNSTNKVLKFYVFCAYNHDDPDYYDEAFWLQDIKDTLERIEILRSYHCLPYIMRHQNYNRAPEPFKGMYITLARYCNQPNLFKKKSLWEFGALNQSLSKSSKPCSTMRYLQAFADKYPDVAKEYFDRKWEG